MPDYLPRKDQALRGWAQHFDQMINSAPADYGLTPELAAEFHVLFVAFESALAVATAPASRTKPSIIAKDAARDAMKTRLRQLRNMVNGQMATTDAQRVSLGFKPQRTKKAPVIPPPTAAPGIQIVSRDGWVVRVKLYDSQVRRIGRPPGVAGAALMAFVGDDPPPDPWLWSLHGQTAKLNFVFRFNKQKPVGTTVWLAAMWSSPTGAFGPIQVVSTVIAGGNVLAA